MVNGVLVLITLIYMLLTRKIVVLTAKSITSTESQFVASHRSFVQIVNLPVDTPHMGKNPFMQFGVTNTGQFPAQITSIIERVNLIPSGQEDSLLTIQSETWMQRNVGVQEIISTGMVMPETITVVDPASADTVEQIKDKKLQYFLRRDIKYIDYFTKTPYGVRQTYLIEPYPRFNLISSKIKEIY